MQVKEFPTYVLLADDYNDAKEFADFLESVIPNHFAENNLVVNLTKYEGFNLEQLLYFLKVSNTHRAKKKSFVMICTAIDVDDIPFEMIVVPTRQEAEDIIEMEEIERDLGF